MHDPEFEKSVRQKMEELKFTPSDSAWANVQKELQKGRKRRKPVLWFLLFAGVAVAGSFYLFNNSNYTIADKTVAGRGAGASTSPDQTKEKTQTNNNNDKDISTQSSNDKKINAIASPNKTSHEKNAVAIDKNIAQQDRQNLNQKKKSAAKYLVDQDEYVIAGSDKNKTEKLQPSANQNDKSTGNNPTQNNQPPDAAAKNNDQSTQQDHVADTKEAVINDIIASNKKGIITDKQPKKDSTGGKKSVAQNKKDKNLKKWEIGFTASPGASSIFENFFKTAAVTGQAPYSYNLTTAFFGLQTMARNYATVDYTPATIKPGLSFSAGAFVEKQFAKKLSFTAGLNYHYYSTSIEIGSKIQTATPAIVGSSTYVNQYYSNTKNHSYANQYHFIELPVSLLYQFNKSRRVQLFGEAGVSLARMIGSNGLHFDNLTAVYYKDNNLFNKTQLNASAAVLVGLPFKKNSFRIGPQVQYGITDLLSKNADSKQHLFFGGIKIVFIPSKIF